MVDTNELRVAWNTMPWSDEVAAEFGATWIPKLLSEIDQLSTTCPPLMGIKEASEYLGESQQYVRYAWYRSRDGYKDSHMSLRRRSVAFPLPIHILACGPVWLASQIEAYKRDKEAVVDAD